MNTITFDLNCDNRPIVDKDFDSTNLNSRVFGAQYELALSQIDNYLSETTLYTISEDDVENNTDNINNIIAFVGDRGSGKTSCMLSVAELLRNKRRKDTFINFKFLKTTNFIFGGMIDPSYFDGKHNLVSLFVSKLYQKYVNEIPKLNIDTKEKNALYDSFSRAQRHLMIMLEKDVNHRSDLEQLTDLAAAQFLKQDIHRLIKVFLGVFGKDDDKLLLLVDDIDLNTTHGAYMAELLRKYFVLPNVVVMISIKLDQFASIKRLEYTNEYKVLLDKNKIKEDEIDEMVERYIAKLFPQSQRIYMPEVESFMEIPLEVKAKNDKCLKFNSVKQSVPELIFWKTRYLFYNSDQQVSLIVPRNLRELRQLLRLLIFMPDQDAFSGAKKHNQTIFRKYLFENWVLNNLSTEYRNDIADILSIESYSQINNKVLKILKNRYEKVLVQSNKDDKDELYYILADKNVDYNISLGDVISILDLFERMLPQMADKRFFFLIRFIYSMRLYESYELLKERAEFGLQEGSLARVYVNEKLSHISEYHRLIGGRFVNAKITDFLPRLGNFSSRSVRPIDAIKLSDFIGECVNNWSLYMEKGYVKLAEFFMLCTYKSVNKDEAPNIQSDTDDKEFRTFSQCAYDFRDFKKSMTFDLGSFFFNISRIEDCYKKFYAGEDFLKKLKETRKNDQSKTLYCSFKQHTINKKQAGQGEYKVNRWLSYCCLRNMEILQDYVNWLSQVDATNKDDAFEMMRKFFTQGSHYKVQTYEKDGEGKPSIISFEFMEEVAKIFAKKNSEIKNKFYDIYPSESVLELTTEEAKEN